MSAGDILDRGLKLMLARLPTFYAINFIVLIPVIFLQILQPKLVDPSTEIWLTFAIVFLNLILTLLGSAASLHVIGQEFIDRRVGVGAAFQFAFFRLGSLLVGLLVFVLGIVAAFMVGMIPGFIFPLLFLITAPALVIFLFAYVSWYGLFTQVIVVEQIGAVASFSRSKTLTEGYRLRFLGILILIVIIQSIVTFALGFVLGKFLPAQEFVIRETPFGGRTLEAVMTNYGNYVIQLVVTYIVSILVSSYLSVCLTLFYFDLRIRKEGYDLEVAAQQQAGLSA
jgi:hypothetical protein